MVLKVKIFVLMIIVSISGLAVPVRAVENTTATTESTKITDDKKQGRAERLQALKDLKTEKLDEAQAKRLALRCKAAQGKIASLRARTNNIIASRRKVYSEIGDKLDVLLGRLGAAGLDISTLQTAREDMRTELGTLSDSMNEYDTLLADLANMDCEADPEAFSAALKSAREVQVRLRTQARDFRQFVTVELRAVLQDIRSQLGTSNDTTKEAETITGSGE